jgi:LmbE family N-acetylglucosaminyl deacetylase
MKPIRRATLLAVFAHPDDELFHAGMLAHSSDRGVRVVLLSATRGEAGKVHPAAGRVDDLPAVRAEELRLSCTRLGIEEPMFLDFHDSGRGARLRRDDRRALVNVDMLEVEAAIRQVIRDVKPHVIVTHDPHGGYYHPDHLVVHRATTAAFYSSAALGPAPERLFYTALESEAYRHLAAATRGRGMADGLDPDVFSMASETIALTFDATPYMKRKLAALAAHRSQFGLTLDALDNPSGEVAMMMSAFRPVVEREAFLVGGLCGPLPSWPVHDLFEGIIGD